MTIGFKSCVDPVGLDNSRKFSVAGEQVLRGDMVGQNSREVLEDQIRTSWGQVQWFRWNPGVSKQPFNRESKVLRLVWGWDYFGSDTENTLKARTQEVLESFGLAWR